MNNLPYIYTYRYRRNTSILRRISDWLDNADSYPLRYIPIWLALAVVGITCAVGVSHIGDWLRDGGLARVLQMVRGY